MITLSDGEVTTVVVALRSAGWGKLADTLETESKKVRVLERFVLHDGSEDAKNDALHTFLGGMAKGPEWEGDDSGVAIWPNWPVRASVGETIVKLENELGEIEYRVERKR